MKKMPFFALRLAAIRTNSSAVAERPCCRVCQL